MMLKFTKDAMISVLLPARGRPDHFVMAVKSVLETAAQPDRVEVLTRLDNDDWDVIKENSHLMRTQDTMLVAPRVGYKRLHECYNELAARCTGDLLFLWNDDTVMKTPGWDDLLRAGPALAVQFIRRDILATADSTFPVLGRPIYNAMGHFANNAHNDTWMEVVSMRAKVAVSRDDVVFHHYRTTDQTSWERDNGGYDLKRFRSQEQHGERETDAVRIMSLDNWAKRFEGFEVKQPTWNNDFSVED